MAEAHSKDPKDKDPKDAKVRGESAAASAAKEG